MRFTLRQLEYFVAVVKSGAVAGAAEQLAVSPSSVSAAITHLEDEFEVLFFVRHHAQGLSLTREGDRFLLEAQSILKQASNLNVVVSALSEEITGPLDVGCLNNVAPIVMPRLTNDFVELHRGIQFQFGLSYASHAELIRKLYLGDISVALTFGFDLPDDIIFTPLVSLPPYVLISAENPLAKKKKISVRELEKEPYIQHDRSLEGEYALSIFLQEGIRPKVAYQSLQYMTVRTMVGNDFGFTFINVLPEVEQALDGSKLVTIPLKGTVQPLVLGIAMIERPFLNPSVTAFTDFCCEQIPKFSILGAVSPAAQLTIPRSKSD